MGVSMKIGRPFKFVMGAQLRNNGANGNGEKWVLRDI